MRSLSAARKKAGGSIPTRALGDARRNTDREPDAIHLPIAAGLCRLRLAASEQLWVGHVRRLLISCSNRSVLRHKVRAARRGLYPSSRRQHVHERILSLVLCPPGSLDPRRPPGPRHSAQRLACLRDGASKPSGFEPQGESIPRDSIPGGSMPSGSSPAWGIELLWGSYPQGCEFRGMRPCSIRRGNPRDSIPWWVAFHPAGLAPPPGSSPSRFIPPADRIHRQSTSPACSPEERSPRDKFGWFIVSRVTGGNLGQPVR